MIYTPNDDMNDPSATSTTQFPATPVGDGYVATPESAALYLCGGLGGVTLVWC
jgi:hypothetical protein